MPNASLELHFPSALAGHAALSTPAMPSTVPLRRSKRPCGFPLHADASRIRLESRSLAAQFDDFSKAHRRHSPRVMRRRFHLGDVLLACEPHVTWSERFAEAAQPALDVSVGQTLRLLHANVSAWPIEHPARSAPDTKSGPPSGLGARSAIHPTALLGFSPFAGLLPMPGANLFPNSRACMPFADRSPRFIFVAEPSVQRGIKSEKGRAIMSLRFGYQASTPVIDPHSRAFLGA